jgi:hypothetical protein
LVHLVGFTDLGFETIDVLVWSSAIYSLCSEFSFWDGFAQSHAVAVSVEKVSKGRADFMVSSPEPRAGLS